MPVVDEQQVSQEGTEGAAEERGQEADREESGEGTVADVPAAQAVVEVEESPAHRQLTAGFLELLRPVAGALDDKLASLAASQSSLSERVDLLITSLMEVTAGCELPGIAHGAQGLVNTRKRLSRVRDVLAAVRKRVDNVKTHLMRVDAPFATC